MFDMMKMMGKVKEAQEKMKVAQESLSNITADGESGAGLVKARVNGKKEVISLDIDASLLSKDDKEMVQDLSVAAINIAILNVDVKAKEHLKSATEGILPNVPGMDLGNLF
ncbi:MAG: YbaB/EbfC family nucleoid-associated protein [Cyclobacteriaceae bacterium]